MKPCSGTAEVLWKTEKPTVPGWYWYKTKMNSDVVVMWVNQINHTWYGQLGAGMCNVAVLPGKWQGPLEPEE